ncbi:MAG: hypothetical protein M0008_00525 [Actinomycetota bacterium]|nr:hypothetical protein [Actinomycetota bacterium]
MDAEVEQPVGLTNRGDFDEISSHINTTPRRSLNWESAYVRYRHALVAKTGGTGPLFALRSRDLLRCASRRSFAGLHISDPVIEVIPRVCYGRDYRELHTRQALLSRVSCPNASPPLQLRTGYDRTLR